MNILRLAWRYIRHDALRSCLVVLAVALVALLPFAVGQLVERTSKELRARAEQTPLLVGARGSRFDLALHALYFRGRAPRTTTMAAVTELRAQDRGQAIPLLVRHTARGHPVVGTEFDYFERRGLVPAEGFLPGALGECVIGSRIAKQRGLGAGDTLLTDTDSIYEFNLDYPLQLAIAGVLAETGTPDDDAVFVDLKTTWILEGIGHGHPAAETLQEATLVEQPDGNRVLDMSVIDDTRITLEDLARFHFHGKVEDFPVSAILVYPATRRDRTILRGDYRVSDTTQALVPTEVIEELLGFVFQVKRFFDTNTVLVATATILFLLLVLVLTIRARQRELATLRRLGCARFTTARILGTELALLVGAGLLLALGLAWVLGRTLLASPL